MGGLSRERWAALIGGQAADRRKLMIWGWVRLATDPRFPKRGGYGVKAPFALEGLDHEEVKVQEGQASR
jgi:hypothetical protein